MSVASHLGITVREYDRRIRTFIPNYAEMLDEVATVLDPATKTIVDLGVGTGALSARCLARAPAARVIGIDADAEISTEATRMRMSQVRYLPKRCAARCGFAPLGSRHPLGNHKQKQGALSFAA